MPYGDTETLNHHASGDHTNSSPGPTALGTFGETSDNEWTGTLYSIWNGTYAHARAVPASAVGDPYVHAFVKNLLSVEKTHTHAESYGRGQKICSLN